MLGAVRRNRWWLGRLAVVPLHVLLFAVVAFFLVRAIPGDPVVTLTGGELTPAQLEEARASLGLNGSLGEQLLAFLGNLVQLDLGASLYTGRTVMEEFQQRVPATVELALLALGGTFVFAVVGAYAVVAWPRNPVSLLLRLYARTAGAIPFFVLAVAGIFLFHVTLEWAPAPTGRVSNGVDVPAALTGFPLLDSVLRGQFEATGSMAAHLVLPVATLVLAQADILMKLLIRGLEDEIDTPQTRFRVSTGVRRSTVLLSVYRRALPPVITLSGTMFGYLLGGAVITESLFGLGALGQYAVAAVNSKDVVALQGFLLLTAAMSLVVFLVVDLVNMLLDPRRRPGVRTEVSS
ncbi:peptide ABC transporter [Pseudonocardia sp. CNS-139]|nr:peptide ABC transporter [Pseudonocardia sp. CNS-139]